MSRRWICDTLLEILLFYCWVEIALLFLYYLMIIAFVQSRINSSAAITL
jgi:hypothetical protein